MGLLCGRALGFGGLHRRAAGVRPEVALARRVNPGRAPAGPGGLGGNRGGSLRVPVPRRRSAGHPEGAYAGDGGRGRRAHAGRGSCAEGDLGEHTPGTPMRVKEPRLHRNRKERLVDLTLDPPRCRAASPHSASVAPRGVSRDGEKAASCDNSPDRKLRDVLTLGARATRLDANGLPELGHGWKIRLDRDHGPDAAALGGSTLVVSQIQSPDCSFPG